MYKHKWIKLVVLAARKSEPKILYPKMRLDVQAENDRAKIKAPIPPKNQHRELITTSLS